MLGDRRLSIGATGAVRAAGAEIVGAKVDCLAAVRAAVVDGLLELLDGHFDVEIDKSWDETKGAPETQLFRRSDNCVWG